MTLLVVAILLAGDPSPEVDGHAVFARTQEVMLGGARLPWLLLASGSVAWSDESGAKASERFVLEWEPCGRRDVRGYLSAVADAVLTETIGVLCGRNPVATARVDRNGSHVRYVWDLSERQWDWHPSIRYHVWDPSRGFPLARERVTIEIDPETGLVSRARFELRWQGDDSEAKKPRTDSRVIGTFEVSDYRPVGTMRLPHRLQLQAGGVREDWTIEQIEIVPLP